MLNNTKTSPTNNMMIMFILLSFFPLMGMTIDLFSPSLPAISSALGLSDGITKLVISLYLLGYALGNFVIGLITDAIGRKSLLRASCLLFIITSILPIIFPNEVILLSMRLAQGFFMGSIAVLNRAIFSDILSVPKLVKLGPTTGLLWGLGPIAGPILGGYFQHYYGWQAGFYFFSITCSILLILIYFNIPETIKKKSKLSITKMKLDLKEVISHKEFMSLVFAMGVAYALIVTFNVLGPFLIQDVMGHSALFFGNLAIFLGLSFIPAPILCRFLLNHFPVNKLFFTAIHICLILTIILFGLSFYYSMSLMLLTIATMVVYFACGFVFPLSSGKGLSMFHHISGTAAAVMYLVNILISCMVSFMENLVTANSITIIILIYLALISLVAGAYWYKLKDLK